ncbi:alpha/beta hydrolase fold domain-containing protein [Saccharopolyspora erythraea]|uniref:alpha/beta hydrolase fold domain-containing protein n=1 Tax=Saccharopolyspora erythraea TaxID=1836 RepID=UPI00138AF4F8
MRPHRPRGATVVYFHGGGFVVGSVDTHLDHAIRIAASTDAVVVSVEYALAPEHPFPAAWVDAVDAVEHVMDDPEIGGEAGRTAVAGDSAGGNLALGAALHCRDAGRPLLGQLLLYPATDLRLLAAIPSHATVNGFYAGTDHAALEDPRVSPVMASHAGLPPTVLSVGSEDFLPPRSGLAGGRGRVRHRRRSLRRAARRSGTTPTLRRGPADADQAAHRRRRDHPRRIPGPAAAQRGGGARAVRDPRDRRDPHGRRAERPRRDLR